MKAKFGYLNSLLFVAVAVLGTITIAGGGSSTSNQAWAEVIEGTEGPDELVGTPGADLIDSKGGDDENFGDAEAPGFGDDVIFSGEGNDRNLGDSNLGDGFGDDVIISGEGDDSNGGDSDEGEGFGDDVIISGEGSDLNGGSGGRDIFVCGDGEDTVLDFNEAEGDIATPDCENI